MFKSKLFLLTVFFLMTVCMIAEDLEVIIPDDETIYLSLEDLYNYPQTEYELEIPWLDEGEYIVTGPLLEELLEDLGYNGNSVILISQEGENLELTERDMEELMPLICIEIDNQPLLEEDDFQLWVVWDFDEELSEDDIFILSSVRILEVN